MSGGSVSVRFNPAPGWPAAPEGWLPEPGWRPDPSWPPAPAGWPIVVSDDRAPETPTPTYGAPLQAAPVTPPPLRAGPPRQRNWAARHKVLTGVGALVAVGVVATAVNQGTSSTGTPSAQPLTPTQSTTVAEATAGASTTPPPPTGATKPPAAAAKAVVYTGKGDKILKIRKPDTGAALISLTYRGSSNFAVQALDQSLQETDLLVNTIGNYSGTTLMDTTDGSDTKAIKLTATGTWTVTLRPLSAAPKFGSATKGTGDGVVLYTGAGGVGTFAGKGPGNFAVHVFSSTGSDLLVNEIGNYSGENVVPAGPALLQITADGPWSVNVKPA